MNDATRTAYYCEGCSHLHDKEQHTPKRLRVELPRANRNDETFVDVFLCPTCSGAFLETGIISAERDKATA